ncbi:MAG: sodium:proton symporter [Clostridiaceae bacterium BRH_c20a]|nr:MAG: sodium:proton symporter [Clostridiaceae bacterium BRH_c20a]
MRGIFYWPGKNLVSAIPLVLILGFITGFLVDTSGLQPYILLITVLMIYPTMIGFNVKEAFNLSYWQVLGISLILNFLLIPVLAFGLGKIFLYNEPQLFAGLVLASLLPTSGMTISWTMLFKGHVAAAVKITAISLILGSFLAPLYLKIMVGQIVPINIMKTFITIAWVVFLPMVLGHFTFQLLLKKYTKEYFQKNIKPIFPSISVWAMLLLIFISISLKSKMIIENPGFLVQGLLVLTIFYTANFAISTIIGRTFLHRGDAVALVYGTVMRNLSLALGLAVTTFGPKAAIMVTLAFILQVQGAAWYGKMASKWNWLGEKV